MTDLKQQEYPSIEEMEKINQFSIYEEDGKHVLYTSICSVGGCEMDGIDFTSYIDALKCGYRMSMEGKEMEIAGACSDCINMLRDNENQRINDRKRRYEEKKSLKGTGSIIKEVLGIECLEFRMFYDSQWKIRIKTDDDREETINLLYIDTDSKEAIEDLIKKCKTVGDIKSKDMTGLIYYD